MREKEIERRCCKIAKNHGWLSMKMVSPNRVGVPDRLFLGGSGKLQFVEFKKPGSYLSPMQERCIREFTRYGHSVWVIDNVEEFEKACENLESPTLLFCRSGARSTMLLNLATVA